MAKCSSITVEIKEGMPNYSSRAVAVTCVADPEETLDIVAVVAAIKSDIKSAWAYTFQDTPMPVRGEAQKKEVAVDPKKLKAKAVVATGKKAKKDAIEEEEPGDDDGLESFDDEDL